VTALMGAFPRLSELGRTGFPPAEYRQSQSQSQSQSLTGDEDLDLYVPPFNPLEVTIGLTARHELELHSPPGHGLSQIQRYGSVQEHASHGVAPYWRPDLPQPPERIRSRPFPSLFDGVNPLPDNFAILRDTSPDGWWNGDRPAMEPNLSAGGSSWSGRTSEGWPEVGMTSSPQFHSWKDFQTTPLDFFPGCSPGFLGYESPKASGIALCEIQQYPDVDSEEPSGNPPPEPTRTPGCFPKSAGFYQARTVSSLSTPDEENESASIPEDDDDRVMDDMRDEDGSDYTPAVPHRRLHRRVTSRATTATPNQSKRPVRARNPSASQPNPGGKISPRGSAPKALAPTPSTAPPTCPKRSRVTCSQCAGGFQSSSALHKHTLASHTRPFTCSFRRYGCPSTFGSKNEWKRHVSSQHLRLGIYRCDMDKCVPQAPKLSPRRKSSSASAGGGVTGKVGGHNDFNRKDLFTQHVRRMHGPALSALEDGRNTSDQVLEAIQKRCWVPLRESPPRSVCGICPHTAAAPATGGAGPDRAPGSLWDGPGTWDDRMEHVGRHLEKGEGGGDEDEDVGLREWMRREGLLAPDGPGRWLVVGCGGRKRGKGAGTEMRLGSEIGTRPDGRLAAGPARNGDVHGDGDDLDCDAEEE
jgi:hypothetical protein